MPGTAGGGFQNAESCAGVLYSCLNHCAADLLPWCSLQIHSRPGGEALVQPDVRPLGQGDRVAEPHVGDLVHERRLVGDVGEVRLRLRLERVANELRRVDDRADGVERVRAVEQRVELDRLRQLPSAPGPWRAGVDGDIDGRPGGGGGGGGRGGGGGGGGGGGAARPLQNSYRSFTAIPFQGDNLSAVLDECFGTEKRYRRARMAAAELTKTTDTEQAKIERWRAAELERAGLRPRSGNPPGRPERRRPAPPAIDLLRNGCAPDLALQILL